MRLTEKGLNIHKTSRYVTSPEVYDLYDKLSKLEDFEDELGIDLLTLFRALKQGGVYVKEGNKVDWEIPMHGFQVCGDRLNGITLWSQVRLEPKDYGKTWALTKKELEENK